MDEFDQAIMEALNESVPPAVLPTNFADRLVARTHRRTRFWRLMLVSSLFAATAGAVITITTLSGDETDGAIADTAAPNTATTMESRYLSGDMDSRLPADGSETAHSTLNYQLSTHSKESPQVQSTTLKKVAALMGALAISATPRLAAAGDYQFIVSGYPAANPSHSAVSFGTSLVVGALASSSASSALEARCRTHDYSLGTSLRSDEYRAMIIIFR